MDDFASVLRKGLAGAGKGPVLLAAGLVSGLVSALGLLQYSAVGTAMLAETADTLPSLLLTFGSVLLPLLAMPFIVGGALGHAIEASAGGSAGWPAFFASAKKHYSSLVLAGIVAFIIFTLLGLPVSLLLYTGMVGSPVLCGLALVGIAIMFLCLMAIEFYDIFVVAEDADFIRAFGASVAFVRKRFAIVLPFFLIVLAAKFVVQLPLFSALFLRTAAELAANYSYYINETAGGALNATYGNTTLLDTQTAPFALPSLLAIAVLQFLLQAIVFAFVISYKVELFRWAKGIKSITDFDYDFSAEKT